MIADKDLLSIQQARIHLENAKLAQKKLADFSQEKLDIIIEAIVNELKDKFQPLAVMSHQETGYGRWQDKYIKNKFACLYLSDKIKGMKVVGILKKDEQNKTMEIGVPLGIIACAVSALSPVSTTIYNVLLAIKSANAIVFSPHPRAYDTIKYLLDLIIKVAKKSGLPDGSISYLNTVTKSGTKELFSHDLTNLVMISGVKNLIDMAMKSGKPFICGGTGSGPAFIERTANIEKAVQDIIYSKTFDNGISPSCEQSLILDAEIAHRVKDLFKNNGTHFMNGEEADRLAKILFRSDGTRNVETIGLSAKDLAQKAFIQVPDNTNLLIIDRKYVRDNDFFTRELFAPVLACYTEDDWQNACEKCIELLIVEENSHSLTIHSENEEVIELFALKKPVARLLVNTPACFGGMGMNSNLFPALTLGSATTGFGITSDNVSPFHLTYTRKVAHGVSNSFINYQVNDFQSSNHSVNNVNKNQDISSEKIDELRYIISEIVKKTLIKSKF